MRLLLLLSLVVQLHAQVSASLTSTMRYNDRTGNKTQGDNMRCTPKIGATVSVSAATNANPAVITATGHGLITGQSIGFTGATGNWVTLNIPTATYAVTVLSANTFSILLDTTTFGALTGTVTTQGVWYCAFNDGESPLGVFNRSVGFVAIASTDLTSANATSVTIINTTADYGVTGSGSINGWPAYRVFKTGGMVYDAPRHLIYWQANVNCWAQTSECAAYPVFSPFDTHWLASDDFGQHWCNPKTWSTNSNSCPHNATTAAGDPIAFADRASIQWQGASNMSNLLPVQFQSGDTADNNATCNYFLTSQSDTLAYYLAKQCAITTLMDVTTYSYYVGPKYGDVLNSSNWCSTSYAACAASMTSLGNGYDIDVNVHNNTMGYTSHLPAPWNTYIHVGTWDDVNGPSTPSIAHRQRVYWAPSMTGPYTPLTLDPQLNANLDFPMFLLDTLTITDATQKTGTITAISTGSFDGPNALAACPTCPNYSPYFSKYTLGPGSPTVGMHKTGNGLQTQGISGIRMSYGNVANALPSKGLQALWMFDDQNFGSGTALSTWPFKQSSETFSGLQCTGGSSHMSVQSTGIRLTGFGDDASNGDHCYTGPSANMPSFLAGDPTFTIITVYKPADTALAALWYFGQGTTTGDGLWLAQSRIGAGDWCVMKWSFVESACTSSIGQFTANNWYFVAVTRTGGATFSTANTKIYRGLTSLALNNFSTVPVVVAGPWYHGAKSDTGNTAYQKPLNGDIAFEVVYNRVLSPAEIKRVYDVMKGWLARTRGATLQ
jgi:hypothetical protein